MKINLIVLLLLLALATSIFLGMKSTANQQQSFLQARVLSQQLDKAFGDLVLNTSLSVHLGDHIWVNEQFDTIPFFTGFSRGGSSSLGIYLNDVQCVECQLDAFRILKTYKDSIGVGNMFIFSNYHNVNELSVLKERAQTDMPVLNALEPIFPDHVYNANTPYFFIIDSSLAVRSLFMHNKSMPAVTERYLKSVSRVFVKHQLKTSFDFNYNR